MKTHLLLLFTFILLCSPAKAQDPVEIIERMFAKTRQIETMTYKMDKRERIDGELKIQVSEVKVILDPLKVYIRQLHPDEGIEVLYNSEESKKALINPNGFPWVNLNLDPLGSTMRKNQHHTIFESGFNHLIGILEHLFVKYEGQLQSMVSLEGVKKFDGESCYVIKFTNPEFSFINYTVKKGEDLDKIAYRLNISQQMILDNNSKIKDHDDVVEGQVIRIPNDYCPEMTLYVSKSDYIPVSIQVYDTEGLYQHYQYSKVAVNAPLASEEFSSDYEEYDF